MATIALPGLASGIDTTALITALVNAESAPMQLLQTRQTAIKQQNTDLTTFGTDVDAVKTALDGIRNAASLSSYTVSSSNTAVSATASASASAGTHTIDVDQLATAERMVQTAGSANETDTVGAGSFVYTYNGQTRTIQTAGTTTLDGLRDLINADGGNPGVSASVLECDVNGAPAYHLVLSGNATGTANAISIDDTNTTLAAFQSGGFTVTQQAQNSRVRVDGYPANTWMERGSNTLTDVIAGVTVQLNSTTASGSPATITASVDTDALKQQVQAFVSAYNTMVTFAQDKTSYDASTKTAGSLLGDYTVSSVLDQLQQPLIGPAAGFDNTKDAYTLASDIGLSLDQNGQLSLNTTTFDDAVSKNYAGVTSLLGATDTGASDSTNLSFYGARDSTAPGAYDVKATFADGVLSSAMIRKTGESDTAWRAATIKDGNLIIGAAGQPEQNLQVVGTYTGSGTVQSQVRVRQGIFGTLDDLIGNSVDSNIKSDEQGQTDQVNALQTSIDDEQTRITQYQADLTQQYAQLEATLSVLQGQKDAISAMTATSTTSS